MRFGQLTELSGRPLPVFQLPEESCWRWVSGSHPGAIVRFQQLEGHARSEGGHFTGTPDELTGVALVRVKQYNPIEKLRELAAKADLPPVRR